MAKRSAMSGLFDKWPDWAKPMFVLAMAAIWIGVPVVAAWSLSARTVQAGGVVDYQPVLAVLVAMTTATIAGIFLFMTFRIDRGTRRKAKRVAKNAAKKALAGVKEAAADTLENAEAAAGRALADVVRESVKRVDTAVKGRLDAVATPEKIRQEVEERITEKELQKHVEAVLVMDANAQTITAYAKEHAKKLDWKTVLRISKLLKEAADSWARCVESKERTGWLAGMWRFFGRWGRSPTDG